jgi:poly-gamma-glutamate synthesis protein (capsule biosynthesis protein)
MSEVVVHAVGDVFADRPDPAEAFSLVRDVLGAADVVFGNCEAPLSTGSAESATTHDTSFVAHASSAAGLRDAGFNVMSCANNHILDAGVDGLLATLDTLRAHGIASAGAGTDLAEAHRHAIVRTSSQTTVAVLAYASFFRVDDVASPRRPGIATVGGETILHTPKGICSPGVAPVVTSVSDACDIEAMVSDIEQANREADLVLTSFHWGDATRPSVLTDHEHRVARSAIDAGADAVLGHHHHVLRGIELFGGKPIFYGLGNFLWDAPEGWAEGFSDETRERMNRLGKYSIRPRPGYPRLPFHPDSRMTMIARSRFQDGDLQWFGFLPCRIRPDGRVEPLEAQGEGGQQVIEFVRTVCDDLQLPVTMDVDAGEQVGGLAAVRVQHAGG